MSNREPIRYQLIRSSRQSIALEIRDGALIVRAPYRAPLSEINRLIQQKEAWVRDHLEKSWEKKMTADQIPPLSVEELRDLAQKAVDYIPGRVRYYAEILQVYPRRITIRNQRTRWGSCSSQGNLNFNCLLMLTPKEVIDSVVVHELCHLKEMNHSPRFYQEVYRVYPEYDKWHGWLKEHQAELMARLG